MKAANLILDASIVYDLRIEYFEQDGSSQVLAEWESVDLNITRAVIPTSVFFHEERCHCSGTGFTGTYCTASMTLSVVS